MASNEAELHRILSRIPYAKFLGMRAELAGDEMTALAQLSFLQGPGRQPRAIDVTVEYLRSGKPMDTFARARMNRVGRRIANIYVEAWQEARAAPVAALHGHFLLTDVKTGE